MRRARASSSGMRWIGPRIASVFVAVAIAGCATSPPPSSAPPTATLTVSPNASSTPSAPASIGPSGSAAAGRLPVGRVVFDRLAGSPEGDFQGAFVMGVDGAATPISLSVPNVFFAGVLSPDGTRLLVSAFTGTKPIVGTLDPATTRWSEIRPDGMVGEIECTDWTPDATHVICSRGGPDPNDDGIYTVDVATGSTTRLTTSAYHHVVGTAGECGGGEGRAVYSGDGSRFAYEQQQCGTGADPSSDEQGSIVVASADGSDAKVIVPFGGVRTHPGGEIAWSPTDDLIAFGTQDGKLSLIAADGTGLRTVDLPQPGFVYGPTWSPDGKWILVTANSPATGQDDLFVVSPDGSTMSQVTDTAEVDAYSDWGVAP
jgi:Tol biopolymer transport system component